MLRTVLQSCCFSLRNESGIEKADAALSSDCVSVPLGKRMWSSQPFSLSNTGNRPTTIDEAGNHAECTPMRPYDVPAVPTPLT